MSDGAYEEPLMPVQDASSATSRISGITRDALDVPASLPGLDEMILLLSMHFLQQVLCSLRAVDQMQGRVSCLIPIPQLRGVAHVSIFFLTT